MSKLYTADKFVTIGGTTAQYVTGTGSLVTFPPIPSGADYIQNQNASAQSANMWISGNAVVNGNVGIGTTTTSGKLTLSNPISDGSIPLISIRDTSNVYEVGYLSFSQSTDIMTLMNKQSYSSSGIVFGTNNAEKMRITQAGNVGIGTSSPSRKLTIYDDLNDYQFRVGYSSSFYYDMGRISSNGLFSFYGNQSGYIGYIFGGADGEFMRINAAGNVGIGTSAPSYKLDVSGTGRFTGNLNSDAIIKAATSLVVERDASDTIGSGSYLALVKSSNAYQSIFQLNSTAGITLFSYDGSWKSVLATNGSTGNVGIGTTAPSSLLEIAGAAPVLTLNRTSGGFTNTISFNSIGNNYGSVISNSQTGEQRYSIGPVVSWGGFHTFYTDTSERMRITTAGNVGIGTSSPSYKTSIHSGAVDTDVLCVSNDQISSDSAQHFVGISLQDQYANGSGNVSAIRSYSNLYSQWGSTLTFSTTGNAGNGVLERMRIAANGNVGIGTTSPSGKFDTYGDGYFGKQDYSIQAIQKVLTLRGDAVSGVYANNSYRFYTSPGAFNSAQKLSIVAEYNGSESSPLLTIQGTGNVGIGASSPVAKLEVNGGSLGFSAYDYLPTEMLYAYNGNSEYLEMGSIRTAAGSDWTSSGFRIQEKIDSTWMSYMQFNGDYNNGGMSFGTGTSSTSRQSIPERMRITSYGYVGIGTGTPVSKLTVAEGDIKVEQSGNTNATISLNPYVYALGTTYQWNLIGGNSGQSYGFQIAEGANTYLHINNSAGGNGGNVGIGTTSPNYKLDVNGTVNIVGAFGNRGVEGAYRIKLADNGGTANDSGIGMDGYSGGGEQMWFNSLDGFYWATGTYGEKMRITQAGNVGIGTGSPNFKLEVNGFVHVGNSSASASGYSNGMEIVNTAGSPTSLFLYQLGIGSGHIGLRLNDSNLYIVNSYTDGSITNPSAITLTSTGNVGMGTTSPSSILETIGQVTINGSATASSVGTLQIKGAKSDIGGLSLTFNNTTNSAGIANYYTGAITFSINSTERMRIDSSGNVGIGTSVLGTTTFGSTPQLVVASSTGGVMDLRSSDTDIVANDTFGRLQFSGKDDASVAYATAAIEAVAASTAGSGNGGGGILKFMTAASGTANSPTERMRITDTGNVGIGTSNPSAPLAIGRVNSAEEGGQIDLCRASDNSSSWGIDVFGSTSTPSLRFVDNVASATRMTIDGNGNVGIGTSTPGSSAILELRSNIKGFLPPKLDDTEMNAISSPEEGLMIYNTDVKTICFFDGSNWKRLVYA